MPSTTITALLFADQMLQISRIDQNFDFKNCKWTAISFYSRAEKEIFCLLDHRRYRQYLNQCVHPLYLNSALQSVFSEVALPFLLHSVAPLRFSEYQTLAVRHNSVVSTHLVALWLLSKSGTDRITATDPHTYIHGFPVQPSDLWSNDTLCILSIKLRIYALFFVFHRKPTMTFGIVSTSCKMS